MGIKDAFISYRREDAAGWAGRLGDDLEDRIGAEHVFRDVKIPAGVDYELHIERVLDRCDVVLVMIGPRWATLTDPAGQVRLHDPDDLLRKEIERALQRPDVEVIPVLVERARMPAAAALPEGLRALTRFQAFELSDHRWGRDFDELCDVVFGATDEPVEPRGRDAAWLAAAGAAGVLPATLLTGSLAPERAMNLPALQRLIVYGVERGVIWALAGALALAAASFLLCDEGTGAVGWAVLGAGFGAAAGVLGGVAFMLLTDAAGVHHNVLRHGVSTAVTGVVLGAAMARVLAGDPTAYRLAGLVGGLLGASLAVILDTPAAGTPEGAMFLLVEAIALFGALAAVRIAVAPPAAARERARAHAVG